MVVADTCAVASSVGNAFARSLKFNGAGLIPQWKKDSVVATGTGGIDYTSADGVMCPVSYTIERRVDGSFEEVLERTEEALSEEGFGILADIDMGGTLEEKVDVDFRKYRVLGACNPPLAYEGLSAEIDLGALLPCNVAVYEGDDGEVVVAAVDPHKLLELADNPELDDIADEVRERLVRALDSVAA